MLNPAHRAFPAEEVPGTPAPIVIAHLSDLHVGAYHPGLEDALVADVAAAAPTLTVISGDLTMRARPAEFARAAAVLDRLPSPRLVVLGNHDVPLTSVTRLWAPYRGYATHVTADLDPVVELPGVRALGLNSMPRWRWKAGRVSRRQAALVRDVLGGAPQPELRLLALHHPVSARGPSGITGRRGLISALAAARVDLVLDGHTHIPAVRRLPARDDGITHRVLEVTTGTATSCRLRGAPGTWTLIRVHPDGIEVRERHHTSSGWQDGPVVRAPRSCHALADE